MDLIIYINLAYLHGKSKYRLHMTRRLKIMENIIMPVFGKSVCGVTEIREKKVVIITPDTEYGKNMGNALLEKVAIYTKDVVLACKNDETLLIENDAIFIIAGNLTDNGCARYLYYKSLIATDLSYPGPGGFEIRTILNPMGKGKNILFIGYSDESGFQKGYEYFMDMINEYIPFIQKVSYTKLPITEDTFESLAQSIEPDNINLLPSAHVNNWYIKSWLAYVTGNNKYREDYIRAWKKLIQFAKLHEDQPGLDSSTSIGMCAHSASFWIAVHNGLIPEDIKADIEKVLYRWMCSNYGIGHVKRYTDHNAPPHNIVMFSALACVYLSDYFIKTYGMNETLSEVTKTANDVFKYFSSGFWRPFCDDSAYAPAVSLPLAVAYSFHEDSHTFLNTSFKDAKLFILATHMPSGFIPSFGDGGVSKLATFICKTYAYYYKDPQIQALCDSVQDKSLLDNAGFIMPMRAFSGHPVKVEDLNKDSFGLIPLNKWHYEQSSKKSNEEKRVPHNKAYDKFYMKKFHKNCMCCTGECKNLWDYFLLDGLGIETHCKNNTVGILDLSINGISCFVEESGYRWPDRENCSTVTISRNGYSGETPELASLDILEGNKNSLYLKTTVPGFNGVDWVREFFIIYGMGVVINDTFTAYEQDDYVFYSHFRVPAVMHKDDTGSIYGNRFVDGCKNHFLQRLDTYSSTDVSTTLEYVDIGSKKFDNGDMGEPGYRKPKGPSPMEKWKQRYGSDVAIISKYTAFTGAKLKPGDSISYTHVLQVTEPDNQQAYFDESENGYCIVFPTDTNDEYCEFDLPFTPGMFIVNNISPINAIELSNKINVNRLNVAFSNIKKATMTDNGNILIFNDDTVALFDSTGNLKFSKSFTGPIRAAAAIDLNENRTIIAAGYNDRNITVLDATGNILWETEIQRQPTMLSGWETKYPKVFSLCFIKSGSSYKLFAGCGDNHVKLFSNTGELINTLFADYRIIDVITSGDYDIDGKTEVLAYASDEASSGILYLYDDTLNIKYRLNAGGWLYTVKAVDYARIDGKTFFAAGVNTNQTLVLFELKSDGKMEKIYTKSVAGACSAVCMNSSDQIVYAGSDKGYIKAFDLTGNEKYSCYVNMAINKIILYKNSIYAVSDNSIKQLDLCCNIIGATDMPSDISDIFINNDKLYIVCTDGIYNI